LPVRVKGKRPIGFRISNHPFLSQKRGEPNDLRRPGEPTLEPVTSGSTLPSRSELNLGWYPGESSRGLIVLVPIYYLYYRDLFREATWIGHKIFSILYFIFSCKLNIIYCLGERSAQPHVNLLNTAFYHKIILYHLKLELF